MHCGVGVLCLLDTPRIHHPPNKYCRTFTDEASSFIERQTVLPELFKDRGRHGLYVRCTIN